MRDTLLSFVFATQTASAPNVTAVGRSPTGILCLEVSKLGSAPIRHTASSFSHATQIAPPPAAIALGAQPRGEVCTGPSPLSYPSGLNCWTSPAKDATHTEPYSTTSAVGRGTVDAPSGSRVTGSTRASVASPTAVHTDSSPTSTPARRNLPD